MNEEAAQDPGEERAPWEIAAEHRTSIQIEQKELGKLARALAPLAREKSYVDLSRFPKVLGRFGAKIPPTLEGHPAGRRLLSQLEGWREGEFRRIREQLGRELGQACEEAGLGMRVLQRDDPVEVRIPPFGVVIDRDKGVAAIRFARQELASCAADAGAILKAHARALAALDGAFDPEAYFGAALAAWRAARAAGGREGEERVEIVDFLPYLAIQMQRPKFRVEPVRANYRDYSRAQFAWDVLRLRKSGGLTQGGQRLNLGVATGTSATKKNRVIFFEDENGVGEFKLTVFFRRLGEES